MVDILIVNIDCLWLPIAWFVVHKHQRLKAFLFVMSCIMTLRLQVQLMEEINYPTGMLSLLDSHVLYRGQIIYSIVIMLFLILAYFSSKTLKIVFFAACLSIYFLTFCFSMVMMLL